MRRCKKSEVFEDNVPTAGRCKQKGSKLAKDSRPGGLQGMKRKD